MPGEVFWQNIREVMFFGSVTIELIILFYLSIIEKRFEVLDILC